MSQANGDFWFWPLPQRNILDDITGVKPMSKEEYDKANPNPVFSFNFVFNRKIDPWDEGCPHGLGMPDGCVCRCQIWWEKDRKLWEETRLKK
jgi:hypothetical protein